MPAACWPCGLVRSFSVTFVRRVSLELQAFRVTIFLGNSVAFGPCTRPLYPLPPPPPRSPPLSTYPHIVFITCRIVSTRFGTPFLAFLCVPPALPTPHVSTVDCQHLIIERCPRCSDAGRFGNRFCGHGGPGDHDGRPLPGGGRWPGKNACLGQVWCHGGGRQYGSRDTGLRGSSRFSPCCCRFTPGRQKKKRIKRRTSVQALPLSLRALVGVRSTAG